MMRITHRIMFISFSVLFSSAGLAEQPEDVDSDDPVLPATRALPASLFSEPQWRLSDTSSEFANSSLPANPLFDIEFQDSNTLKQLSKLRNLSFVTLAEQWNSQLFLGVNDDGLVGLHFTLLPRRNKDHILELARLPHLQESKRQPVEEQARKRPH